MASGHGRWTVQVRVTGATRDRLGFDRATTVLDAKHLECRHPRHCSAKDLIPGP